MTDNTPSQSPGDLAPVRSGRPLAVGDKLWSVARRDTGGGGPREVTVTKIGNKWATLDFPRWKPDRVNIQTLAVDGGDYSSPGQCYRSRAEYELETAVRSAWANLYSRLCRLPPDGVDLEWIEAAHERLGIPK